MPRILLLLPTTTYRARDFLRAAEKLRVDIVVASEERSTMEGLQPGKLLTLNFLDPEDSARRTRAFAEDYPIDSVVPVDEGLRPPA